jgi:hypothetical protein
MPLDELLANCGSKPEAVTLWKDVKEDAEKFFHLKGKSEILGALTLGEVCDLKRFELGCKPANFNPRFLVEAYTFNYKGKGGYLAFFKSEAGWVIKSFHLSNEEKLKSENLAKKVKKNLGKYGIR